MIGSTLVKRLVASGHRVKVVDNLWRGKLEYLHDDRGKPVIDWRPRVELRDGVTRMYRWIERQLAAS